MLRGVREVSVCLWSWKWVKCYMVGRRKKEGGQVQHVYDG